MLGVSTMGFTGRQYNKEFKVETVRMITENGLSVSTVAKNLGINSKTLYGWLREYTKYKDDAFPGSGKLRPEEEEIRKLKLRIADLEEENEILKKARAFFVNHRS